MSIFGDIERLLAALYPLRVPIFIGGLIVLVGLAILARRRRWDLTVRRHPRVSAAILAAVLIVGLPLGWILGSPIFIRTELAEGAPTAAGANETDTPSGTVLSGSLSGEDEFHFASGTVTLIETAPDTYVLRFEGISVRNGPDLFVYLSPSEEGYTADALELGGLKASDGSFNYEVPPGTDITRFKSAVIWCKAFSVQFATATLGA